MMDDKTKGVIHNAVGHSMFATGDEIVRPTGVDYERALKVANRVIHDLEVLEAGTVLIQLDPAHGVVAPFTDKQVERINAYQTSGVFHELTCPNSSDGEVHVLYANTDGLHCHRCDYRQSWVPRVIVSGD